MNRIAIAIVILVSACVVQDDLGIGEESQSIGVRGRRSQQPSPPFTDTRCAWRFTPDPEQETVSDPMGFSELECDRTDQDSNCRMRYEGTECVPNGGMQPGDPGGNRCDLEDNACKGVPGGVAPDVHCTIDPATMTSSCYCACSFVLTNGQYDQMKWPINSIPPGDAHVWLGLPMLGPPVYPYIRHSDQCFAQFGPISRRPWTVGAGDWCVETLNHDGVHCLKRVPRCIGEL
jgi:hypothetical protein